MAKKNGSINGYLGVDVGTLVSNKQLFYCETTGKQSIINIIAYTNYYLGNCTNEIVLNFIFILNPNYIRTEKILTKTNF